MRFDRVTLRLGGIQRERYLTKVKFSSIFIRTDEFVYIYIHLIDMLIYSIFPSKSFKQDGKRISFLGI